MKGSMYNTHADFRVEIWEKKSAYYTRVNMGTKVKNQGCLSFIPLLKQHTDYQLYM